MRKFILFFFLLSMSLGAYAQQGTDTLHYRKAYLFSGTGMGFPLGKTADVLRPKFSGSLGLDISLKDSKFYVYPSLYTLSFGYNQLKKESEYNYTIENGTASMYNLNLAGGIRKQWERLNTYVYIGPGVGLLNEPRAKVDPIKSHVLIEDQKSIFLSGKMGFGADYKFKGFYVGLELGLLHNFKSIQDTPVNIMTVMLGLKTDITKISDKVVSVLGVEGSISGHTAK
ncbi:hypothetical protein J5U18_12350 [Sphingobacteriaceae bacterium WQ 2009]|uniref:Outer membrane protein beta-barrel domain-containing protein n=1 Tax=Rhinopithecimicrobium faecis TaxID=2820698 RepID=A0A8T4HI43_9SPHI|nr:hypothetical protein [Sphingobacteriaceae bacterium WQ 2009]